MFRLLGRQKKLIRLKSFASELYGCPVCKNDFDVQNLNKTDNINSQSGGLDEWETNILIFLASCDGEWTEAQFLFSQFDQPTTRTQHFIDKLVQRNFVSDSLSGYEDAEYLIAKKGREYLIENKLI